MLNEAHLQTLLEKALAGQASDEELRTLVEALQHDEHLALTEQVTALLSKQHADYTLAREERVSTLADAILQADKLPAGQSPAGRKAPVIALWKKIAAAAIIVGVAVTAFYLWQINRPSGDALTGDMEQKQGDVNPGYNKARLILADGSIVVLDSAANGTLSQQGQTRIAKRKDGQLSYSFIDTPTTANIPSGQLFNTVVVPRGGQYQLILADGSQVWLNAASSLRFPVAFTGNERIVELEGEGYFEVAKDAARPFAVRTRQADVQVLGTHFNVCAYPQEDWKTTLLEGKVRVVSGKQATGTVNRRESGQQAGAILEPGQQAIIAATQSSQSNQSPKDLSRLGGILVQTADIDEAIAWKEGYFHFNDASVVSIMRQVSRWYDVDIAYKDSVSRGRFNGRINRAIRLSGVVNALKQGGINCAIEQNRLLVYP